MLAIHPEFEDLTPIPGVCEVAWHPPAGDANHDTSGPALLIEVPHGATRPRDYHDLRARLVGALPAIALQATTPALLARRSRRG